jgi:hypothetical protein
VKDVVRHWNEESKRRGTYDVSDLELLSGGSHDV